MNPCRGGLREGTRPGEHGSAILVVLVALLLVTAISISLVGLAGTDMTHAAIQSAAVRTFYVAQAGLEEAKIQTSAAADPSVFATPAAGVTASYGGGQFTYWVDAGPATGCGPGLKTLDAQGQVPFLARMFSARVRACAVPGVPFLAALFGVARIQLAASRVYLAPYLVGTPGGGGSLGSFTEINFSDGDVRLNALSEQAMDTVALRDGSVFDYTLFGFDGRPDYTPSAETEPAPWILAAFGDLIKAQATTGAILNRCGTPYACLTVANGLTDVDRITDLRETNYVRHVYMRAVREEVLPPLALPAEMFPAQAAQNTANAAINKKLPIRATGSLYRPADFYRVLGYLSTHPGETLQGVVYVDGPLQLIQSVNLGNVTLAVGGDLVLANKAAVVIRHDLSSVSGRQTPGIIVLGASAPGAFPARVCGTERANGSGRLVMCAGTTLTVDGLVYTRDGMAMDPGAAVDQVGAMYHDNRGTPNPSFAAQNATLVLRFDPLALSVFHTGMTVVSWQQLQ